jgi:hypothetical protein
MTSQQNPVPAGDAASAAPDSLRGWSRKFAALLYIIFCLELGAFLVAFPWSPWWHSSFIAGLAPGWYDVWISPYLRGAVSGIGVLDIGIAFVEVFRLRRFAERAGEADARGSIQ